MSLCVQLLSTHPAIILQSPAYIKGSGQLISIRIADGWAMFVASIGSGAIQAHQGSNGTFCSANAAASGMFCHPCLDPGNVKLYLHFFRVRCPGNFVFSSLGVPSGANTVIWATLRYVNDCIAVETLVIICSVASTSMQFAPF